MSSPAPPTDYADAPFGTRFGPVVSTVVGNASAWSEPTTEPLANLSLHPASHALHYGSSCFEGLKAYRWPDGSTRLFRADRHAARLTRSAELLCIPCPPIATISKLIEMAVSSNHAHVPQPPGALYLRPTLIGTEANIGAAGSPSESVLMFVLTSPVGNYFTGEDRAIRLLIDDQHLRAPPGVGQAKTGGNYAAALPHTVAARQEHNADQVLFCPAGDVQETGASNFFLINDEEIVTKPLDDTFLHGVTRDSILQLAAQLQYRVSERNFTVADIFEWIEAGGEAALSGTAAVMTGVGTFIHNGVETQVGDGQSGKNTRRLRATLTAMQSGTTPDSFGWSTTV